MEQERASTLTSLEEDNSGMTFDPSSSSSLKDTEEFEQLDEEYDDEEEDEDDFTFACTADDDDELSFAAEDMFDNGKIKPVFPLFDQTLVDLPHLPSVNKFFVAADSPQPPTQTAAGEIEASGYASLRQAVEAHPSASSETCKKSNSTGFSKIWRFKEMTHRSHSDGRDAFVFLKKPSQDKKKKKKDSVVAAAEKPAATVATKKKGKEATTSISVHEAYIKSKSAATREEDRRRPYLQYKPVGFFTNIHGGMSKNVHPF